jgi:peroxiredoxin/outer membrane lipoprotein-sorting protein
MRKGALSFIATALIGAALVLPCSATAASEKRNPGPSIKGDVSALAIYRGMHDAFRDARTLSYESEYVWETGGKEIGHSTYRVWLKKPNYARLESRSSDGAKIGVLILDGREMWIYWPNGRPYIHDSDSTANTRDDRNSYIRKDAKEGSHSIARETSVFGTGMSMAILDPSIFHGSPDLMDAVLESVKNAGSGNVDGETCDVIDASYQNGERTRVFWVARRDHLPRMLEETVHVSRDIVVREHWRGVVVNGAIAKEIFSWKPPAGWAEYRLRELEDGLLKPGGGAPDFDLVAIDGTRFRLSENRGKVVWLSFWRLSCIPCRKELRELQKLYDKHAKDGLVVLGFDCSDDRVLAAEFLREQGLRFPSIADTTAAAREVFYEKYQVSKGQGAVPLNYIIDRQGRVVAGWYGYARGDSRGTEILRRLGIGR